MYKLLRREDYILNFYVELAGVLRFHYQSKIPQSKKESATNTHRCYNGMPHQINAIFE